MRNTVVCVLMLASTVPAYAFDSAWQQFESYRILARNCPAEIQAAMKGLPVADLDEVISIIHEREAVFTSKVSFGGDAGRARKSLDDYREAMIRQLDSGVKTKGCAGVIQQLRLDFPKPLAKQQLVDLVRSIPLPSTERTDAIPPADRIGTVAAYPLQKIITRAIVGKRQCDLSTLKAKLVNEAVRATGDVPPFAGTPKSYDEQWELICDGQTLVAQVTFFQDARKWRHYRIDQTSSGGAGEKTLDDNLRKGLRN